MNEDWEDYAETLGGIIENLQYEHEQCYVDRKIRGVGHEIHQLIEMENEFKK